MLNSHAQRNKTVFIKKQKAYVNIMHLHCPFIFVITIFNDGWNPLELDQNIHSEKFQVFPPVTNLPLPSTEDLVDEHKQIG